MFKGTWLGETSRWCHKSCYTYSTKLLGYIINKINDKLFKFKRHVVNPMFDDD